MNSGAKLNFISQLVVKEAALMASINGATQARTLNSQLIPIYGMYKVQTYVTDLKGHKQDVEDLFCAINLKDYNMVLGYP
jgi:hypothetical protein